MRCTCVPATPTVTRSSSSALDELLPQIPKEAKIIPGHGPLSTVEDVRKFRAKLDEIVGLVDRGLKSGKSVEQLQKEKVLAAYASWEGPFVKADQFIAIVARDLQSKR